MTKIKHAKIGDVIQFPAKHYGYHEYDWIYGAGIIEQFGTIRKTGEKVALIRYCTRTAGRYQLLPNVEATKWVKCKYLYEFDVDAAQERYRQDREFEKNGEKVCWDQNTALLLNHGIIKED